MSSSTWVNVRRAAVLLVCAGSLAACIYEEPLVPGNAEKPDTRVLGRWRCVSPDDQDAVLLDVALLPDQRYKAVFGSGNDQSTFQAYAVKFDGRTLLNAQEVVNGNARKWSLVRSALLRPDVLHLETAREEPFRQAQTPQQRTAVLLRLLKTDTLFEDFCTCVRVKK